jgi:hypothetical protein
VIVITLDTHSHVAPGLQQAAEARFDKLLNPEAKKEVAEKMAFLRSELDVNREKHF